MASLALKDHRYTAEEDAWLRENLDRYTYPELTDQFNALFGTKIKSVSDRCIKRLGLHKAVNTGNLQKGNRITKTTLPVGSEVLWNGNLWVKVADAINECRGDRMPNKRNDPNWERKDEMVWRAKKGAIPKRYLLIHLDMDAKNCALDNLYLVNRKVNFMMAKNGWYQQDKELTLTAIKWCELFYTLKGTESWNGIS